MINTRALDLMLAVIASAVGFALSWPFHRDFGYWAESQTAWYIYFIIGYCFAVYVFYVFIGSTRMLFFHDSLLRRGVIQPGPVFDDAETKEQGK